MAKKILVCGTVAILAVGAGVALGLVTTPEQALEVFVRVLASVKGAF